MEGYPQGVTVSSVSSDSTVRGTTEMSSNQRTRLLQTTSNVERPILPVTSVTSSFLSGEMSIPTYNSSTAGRYSDSLSEGPTSGYATEPSRFSSHLTASSGISSYDPRSFTYNSGEYPIHQRQELSLNYGHVSQPYSSQTHQANIRTDAETYNAALALVESQNKIFTDEAGGQYYQLEGNTSGSSNYEVIHTNIIDHPPETVAVRNDDSNVAKVIYVTEKPHIEVQPAAEKLQTVEGRKLENLEETPESHIEVVIETVDLEDIPSKTSDLQDTATPVSEIDSTEGQNQVPSKEISLCKPGEGMKEAELKVSNIVVPKEIVQTQEPINSSVPKVDKIFKDTASQIEGPHIESRFGVLLEELRDTPSGKACYIKLKPVKHLDLESFCNRILFDIEIDNDLQVSSLEQTYVSEKTSVYSFNISARKGSKTKTTSKKNNIDKTHLIGKSGGKCDVVAKEKKTVLKEEISDVIMTRGRRRKMAKPLKKAALKNIKKSQTKKSKSQHMQLKFNSNKGKESKKSKPKTRPSKELEVSDLIYYDDADASMSDDYDYDDDKDSDFEPPSVDNINTAKTDESRSAVEIKEEKIDKSEKSDQTSLPKKEKLKLEKTDETKTEMSSSKVDTDEDMEEEGIEKKGKKRKADTEAKETKPKRKYTKRQMYNKTEVNYSVRKTESGQRICVCNICSYESKQTGNMRSHMRARHTEEKPFECNICHKQFSSQSNLRGHWSIHKDERPYLCSICGQAFKANSNLQKHIMRHLGDKRFSCSTCGKQFVTSTDLRRHYRVHSSEKSFLCDLCPKGFKDGTSLARHKFCHTGEKNHLCAFCGEAFARKDNCYTHIKKHHCQETDILPAPLKRLEHYVNSPELEERNEEETKEGPNIPQPDSVVVSETVRENGTQSVVVERQLHTSQSGKSEGTYTQLMAVDEMSDLSKITQPQQYQMYVPISMQGPSW